MNKDQAQQPPDKSGLANNSGRPLLKSTRLRLIVDAVNLNGFASVDDLAEKLGVSRMTVHRDLDELQRIGSLRKIRGGASAHRSTQYESDLQFRATSSVEEKKRIAAAAADLASEGDVVIVDDSTTVLEIIPFLAGKSPLTVITNFIPAMQQVRDHPELNLIGLGGEYVARYQAFLGMICERTLGDLYADILFASTSALRGFDLYHQDQRVITTKRAMINAAQRRVLLMDHTKIDHRALHRLCSISEFTHVVVDGQVDGAVVKGFEESGIEVIVTS